jgi:hypothetical protein
VRSVLSGRYTYSIASNGPRNGSTGSSAATEIWMSMIGLAANPGTAVEPMWSIRSAKSPSASRSPPPSWANRSAHAASYDSIRITSAKVPLHRSPLQEVAEPVTPTEIRAIYRRGHIWPDPPL